MLNAQKIQWVLQKHFENFKNRLNITRDLEVEQMEFEDKKDDIEVWSNIASQKTVNNWASNDELREHNTF